MAGWQQKKNHHSKLVKVDLFCWQYGDGDAWGRVYMAAAATNTGHFNIKYPASPNNPPPQKKKKKKHASNHLMRKTYR
jgi:hypothetical protein